MTEEPSGRAAGTAADPIHVEREGNEVPLSLLLRLVGLTFLGYVVISVGIGLFLLNQQHDARFRDQRELSARLSAHNEALTRRFNRQRVAQDRKIATAVANLCASAELRDTVIANQNAAIVALLRTVPPPVPPTVQRLIDVSRDGIQTLEPRNEEDCPLPPGSP